MRKVVVDLGNRESCSGLTYVALSRAQVLESILLIPVSRDRFALLSSKKELQVRLTEEKRLLQAAAQTLLRYPDIVAESNLS